VKNETQLRLHRAAGKDTHRAGGRIGSLPDCFEQRRQRLFAERTVDDQPHRAALIVADHQDDGLPEARVAHAGGGDQELAGEPGPLRQLAGVGRSGAEQRCRQQDRDKHETKP
jgi:hypothetical protein